MAVVATIVAADPTYLPYERPPQPVTLWTAIPRGLRGFKVVNGTLDAKPINDQQRLSITGTLPANFGYVFSGIGLRMTQDRMQDWEPLYHLNLQSWYQGETGLSMTWAFATALNGLLKTESNTRVDQALSPLPKEPMWAPKGSSGILINVTANNANATAALAGTFAYYIGFWEFDLEQMRKYPINAPLPVHSR